MQTYSLFLFISGKFWKFWLVHHYHFQLGSDHVYFCFCLLIFPHASPSETTVKMKPFLFIFRVEPGGPPAQRRTTFCLFPSVMSSIYRERPKKSVSRVSIESRCPRNVKRRQQVRFLYRSFYVNMENLHFFFWSCCYLGVLSNRHTSLSIRVHALWMSYNEQSLYLYLKKKNCPRILKSTLRPSPTVLSCNRVDVTLTSMYTKVLTEWDDTKRSTKCWQRNLSQNSPLPVLINFVWFTIQ